MNCTSLKPLAEQVVVITGASSGIGRLAATCFCRKGAKVLVCARGEEGLKALVNELKSEAYGDINYMVCDVSNFAQVKALADEAIKLYGRIDTWVNNAAVALFAPADQTTPEEYKKVMEINYLGYVHGTLAALSYMKQQGQGSIINVTGAQARISFPNQAAYCAAEHAIEGFLHSLRLELSHHKVPINLPQLLPWTTNTPFYNKAHSKIGVKPRGMPPVYKASVVVENILWAATHHSKDLPVGTWGSIHLTLQKWVPGVYNWFLESGDRAYRQTQTGETMTGEANNNLNQPTPGGPFDRVEGEFGDEERGSVYDWFRLHPTVRRSLYAVGLGLGVVLLV